jgi:hypothetical protein
MHEAWHWSVIKIITDLYLKVGTTELNKIDAT